MIRKIIDIWSKISSWSILLLLFVSTAISMLITYLFINDIWEFCLIFIFVWIYLVVKIMKISRRNINKLTFMFDAIDNSDYNFKYSTDNGSYDDRMINESLNRVTQILIRARDEAKLREKYYEIILESVSTGVIVVDNKGNIYQSNSEALRLLGLKVLTHISQIEHVDRELQKVLQEVLPGEKRQVTFNNKISTINLSVHSSTALLNGLPVRVLALSDIHSELEEKELDSWVRLTRVLTHEIMNSVTPITSLCDTILADSRAKDPKIRHGLEVISSTGKGLIAFVENYRQLTRLPSPKPSPFYVAEFLDRMKSMAEHQPEAKNIKIIMDGIIKISSDNNTKDEPLLLYADENLIDRVVSNLLKNALQAIGTERKDGEIHLRALYDESESIYIEVSNNGPLIPLEEQEHIFVPFYTTKEGGSGIGLSLSRQIMRLSGGTLTLNSDAKRNITTFTLKFI